MKGKVNDSNESTKNIKAHLKEMKHDGSICKQLITSTQGKMRNVQGPSSRWRETHKIIPKLLTR